MRLNGKVVLDGGKSSERPSDTLPEMIRFALMGILRRYF